MENTYYKVGLQFKEYRERAGVKKTVLSRWSGVSRATILRFEKGGGINTDLFEKLLECLDGKVIIVNKKF